MSIQKIAIVTGGGTGIGSATCRRLAKDGYALVVAYAHSAESAQAVVEEVLGQGGSAFSQRVDISVEEDVIELFESTLARYGRVDVVINNAGVGHMKAMKNINMDEYDRIFSTNTRGTFMMSREAAKHLMDGGRIVNISTGATRSNMHSQSLYTASKIAVEGFTKVLAKELGSKNITVNIVSPGMTDTPMLEGGDAEALRQYGAKSAAMRRCGTPEDIADAISALVSDDCRWITGQNISVCGGTTIV